MRHDPIHPSDPCTVMQGLPPEALEQVAAYFRTLSEPTRLHILNLLRGGEQNVGELAVATGCAIWSAATSRASTSAWPALPGRSRRLRSAQPLRAARPCGHEWAGSGTRRRCAASPCARLVRGGDGLVGPGARLVARHARAG